VVHRSQITKDYDMRTLTTFAALTLSLLRPSSPGSILATYPV